MRTANLDPCKRPTPETEKATLPSVKARPKVSSETETARVKFVPSSGTAYRKKERRKTIAPVQRDHPGQTREASTSRKRPRVQRPAVRRALQERRRPRKRLALCPLYQRRRPSRHRLALRRQPRSPRYQRQPPQRCQRLPPPQQLWLPKRPQLQNSQHQRSPGWCRRPAKCRSMVPKTTTALSRRRSFRKGGPSHRRSNTTLPSLPTLRNQLSESTIKGSDLSQIHSEFIVAWCNDDPYISRRTTARPYGKGRQKGCSRKTLLRKILHRAPRDAT